MCQAAPGPLRAALSHVAPAAGRTALMHTMRVLRLLLFVLGFGALVVAVVIYPYPGAFIVAAAGLLNMWAAYTSRLGEPDQ